MDGTNKRSKDEQEAIVTARTSKKRSSSTAVGETSTQGNAGWTKKILKDHFVLLGKALAPYRSLLPATSMTERRRKFLDGTQ